MRCIGCRDARLLQEARGPGLPDKILRACDCRVQDRGEMGSLRTPRWKVRGAILPASCREPREEFVLVSESE